MTTEFQLPELGENIESGDVVNVLVHEGQRIAANDGVIELETDKAVIEIPCPHAGKVAKIHCRKGDTVRVGQTLLSVETEADAPDAAGPAAAPAEKPAAEQQAKATATAPPATREPSAKPQAPAAGPIPAGPAARRVARELGIELGQIQGTGQRGRITPDDVHAAAAGPAKPAAQAAAAYQPIAPPGEPGQDAWGPIRREKMSKIRRTIAAQMVKSASTVPHVTNIDDADVTDLENLRKGVPADYVGPGLKLTAMPFVIRAVAWSLRRHPMLNASIDESNEQVVYKEYVSVGVAVDTPRGLVVPALRQADRMTIPQIARELAVLAQRARAAEFAVEDLRGGTFTISNLGAVGGTYSTPIINHPEVAILLVGRSRWLPMVRDGRIEPRLMMPLSLSFDHRLVDGAAAGRFLNEVIGLLQSPGKLLLGE